MCIRDSSLSLLNINSVHAKIYFNAKIAGPITNVSSLDNDNIVQAETPGSAQQDREFSVFSNGENNLIAFTSDRSENQNEKLQLKAPNAIRDTAPQLFLKSQDQLTKISQGKELAFSPKLNSTGTQLAYLKVTEDKQNALYLYDIKSKSQKIIAINEKIFDLNWSSDDSKIAYSHVDKNISKITIITVNDNIRTVVLEQNTDSEKTLNPAYLVSPTWSHDDENIAFITHPTNQKTNKVVSVINLKSKEITQISNKNHQAQSPISWSHDNKHLIYSALVDYKFYYSEQLKDRVYEGAMHIFISTLEGEIKQLTQGDHYHGRPTFSPNNKEIAYLYAEKLGDQRNYVLHVIDLKSGEISELYQSVSRDSLLIWTGS